MGSNNILKFCDPRQACRREWPRRPMLVSARLLTVTGEQPVRIRDLSPGGARIEGWDLPPVATEVLLKRAAFEAFGTIAWISDNQSGIQFETELDEQAFEALESPHAPDQRDASRQPGFGAKTAGHARWSDGSGWIDL